MVSNGLCALCDKITQVDKAPKVQALLVLELRSQTKGAASPRDVKILLKLMIDHYDQISFLFLF
jgi:hypothetical protein